MASRIAAFTEEERAELEKSKKVRKPKPQKEQAPITENATEPEEKSSTAATRSGPDGIHAVRGMSLMINEMLAMGCFTPDEIIACILPYTRDRLKRQAKTKLTSHLKNMQKHGATIGIFDDKYIYCADVVLPELKD